MTSPDAPNPNRSRIFRRSRPPVTPGDTLYAPDGHHYQPYDASGRVLGDLRLRVTAVPPGRNQAREGFLLLRGYLIDADGFEAVRETWHYVRLAWCRVVTPPGRGPQ